MLARPVLRPIINYVSHGFESKDGGLERGFGLVGSGFLDLQYEPIKAPVAHQSAQGVRAEKEAEDKNASSHARRKLSESPNTEPLTKWDNLFEQR